MRRIARIGSGLVFTIVLALAANPAWAGFIDCVPQQGCGWTIEVDGEIQSEGTFVISIDGDIQIVGDTSVEGPDFTADISSFGGNVDPEILFGIGATNSSSAAKTYAFAFSLPLGGFNFGNAILTEAALGTTLTASSSANALLFPTLGGGKVVDSQDLQFSPFASVDKGVDIGDSLTDPAGGLSTLRNELENGVILAGFSFDLMTVTVAFGLVDDDQQLGNPGQVAVGLSGRVTQVVPEPATGVLVALGLVGLSLRSRRQSPRAR